MPSAKKYVRAELLERAIALFWRKGFNGTTTAELVAALGVNRKSMYAEFGSKQGLFEAALAHYDGHQLSMVLRRLEAPEASLDTIRGAFEGYARANEGRIRGLGCLLTNTAVDRGALEPSVGPFVDGYLARVAAAFRHALGRARAAGTLADTADVDQLAHFFTMSLVGMAALVRAEAPVEQTWAAARVVGTVVDLHTVVPA